MWTKAQKPSQVAYVYTMLLYSIIPQYGMCTDLNYVFIVQKTVIRQGKDLSFLNPDNLELLRMHLKFNPRVKNGILHQDLKSSENPNHCVMIHDD